MTLALLVGIMDTALDAAAALREQGETRLAQHRDVVRAGLADILPMLMLVSRYKHLSLSDMEWAVVSPLLQNRIAMARSVPDGPGTPTLKAFALWATVDAQTEDKIKDQIGAQVFPIRLRADEWRSGDRVWLLDVISESRDLATQLFIEFGKSPDVGGSFQTHPIISSLVDKDVLGATKVSD